MRARRNYRIILVISVIVILACTPLLLHIRKEKVKQRIRIRENAIRAAIKAIEPKPCVTTSEGTLSDASTNVPEVFNAVKENMTLVTAYFDLGTLNKGRPRANKDRYKYWAMPFRYIVNPLVVYTDSDDFYNFMTKLRCALPNKTKILKIDRKTLWAFQIVDKIQNIFTQPGYPKHQPNTVKPDYSSAQHAKYAVVTDAIKQKYFENEFYAWIDIGYFRDSVKYKSYFQLFAPKTLNKTRIAFNKVRPFKKDSSPHSIFRGNKVWVGGGMFIGTPTLLLEFEQLYRRTVDYFLNKKLMNTDQQVLYALYCDEGRRALKPEIELQLYVPGKYPGDEWFYLGYHCRCVLPDEVQLFRPSTPTCNNDTWNSLVKIQR